MQLNGSVHPVKQTLLKLPFGCLLCIWDSCNQDLIMKLKWWLPLFFACHACEWLWEIL